MSQDPSLNPTALPAPTQFERYLEEVKTSMQLNQLQLTSSAVSMERCRNAIEWQQAVHQQFALITQAFSLNIHRLDDWGRELLSQPLADDGQCQVWLSLREMAVHMDQSVKDMASRGPALQAQLLILGDAVTELEHLSSELARFNDSVGEKVALFSKTLENAELLRKNGK